jgi:hypothetical protein
VIAQRRFRRSCNDEVRVLVESSKPVEQFEITIDWNNRTVYVTDAKGTTFTIVGAR